MRDVLPKVLPWWQAGRPVAVATVVATWLSAPRLAGATMAVGPDGEVAGSVSGGCVEGAVYELGEQVAATGTPLLQRYGVSTADAFAVGLTCGGTLEVFVEQVSPSSFPELGAIAKDLADGRPVAVVTLVEHTDPTRVGARLVIRTDESGQPAASGSLGSDRFDSAVVADARGLLAAGRSETLGYGTEGERLDEGARVFVAAYAPPPRMLVFGAIDYASALERMGTFLGYHMTVCDARAVFTTTSRFPDADEVIVDWPHRYLATELAAGRIDRRTVIAVLTHDPRFDVPALEVALRADVAYVCAMGS